MLDELKYLSYSGDIMVEAEQAADEGRDVPGLAERAREISAMTDAGERERLAAALMDDVQRKPQAAGALTEPDGLSVILSLAPGVPELAQAPVGGAFVDRMHGAWLGRCAGCLLGKPFEGWPRARITGLLRDIGQYPPRYYVSTDIPAAIKKKHAFDDNRAWIDRVHGMPVDDDTNYTMLGILMLEKHGARLTTKDVAVSWLERLPVLTTFTAERVAMRNLVLGVAPHHAARFRNPFREWIGAQIRADAYGYVFPGDPLMAAKLAHADASLSHVKNGIYGAMMAAAMVSAAFVTDDVQRIITAGLSVIPRDSRLAAAVRECVGFADQGMTLDECCAVLHSRYDESNKHHWCHTISNAMIVIMSLIYGKLDLERTISAALIAGFDTDCNCATAGSIVGAAVGASQLPKSWCGGLRDTLHTSIGAESQVSIAAVARRTCDLAALIGAQR